MSSPIVQPETRSEQDDDVSIMIRAAALEAAVASVKPTGTCMDDSVFDNDTVYTMMRACAFEYYLRTGKIALPRHPNSEIEGTDDT